MRTPGALMRAATIALPALLAIAPAAAGDGVVLRYRLEPLATYEQLLTVRQHVEIVVAGAPSEAAAALSAIGSTMDQDLEMAIRFEVGEAAADGTMPLAGTMDVRKATLVMGERVMDLRQMMPDLTGLEIAGRVHPDGRAVEIAIEGLESSEMPGFDIGQFSQQLLQGLPTFPQDELQVGDSFEMPLQLSLPVPVTGGTNEMSATSIFTLRSVDGDRATFDVRQNFDMSMNMADPERGASRIEMSGGGSGESEYDAAAGLLTRMSVEMDIEADLTFDASAGAEGGTAEPVRMTMSISGPITHTMRRVE